MRRKIAALIVFLASSQTVVMAEDVFNPTKPIIGYTWFQQLTAVVDRIFAWL